MVLIGASLVVNYYAGQYATLKESGPVTDLILSNIRVYDVDGIFVYGSIALWIFVGLLCLLKPNRIPFLLKSIALFILIRSIFVILTHVGPFPTQMPVESDVLAKFTFGGDLFFSGHTGLPFLMALLFWREHLLRYFFIFASVGFGIVVLLAHLHYSIDVLSAFFITYGIYEMAKIFFTHDFLLFHETR